MKRLTFGLALAALLLASAMAQAAEPVGQTLGVVDMNRVTAEYRQMQQLERQFQEFQNERKTQFQQHHKTRLLFDDEQREFLDSSQMAAPTEARDERLAELEELSNQRERRLFELRQNKARSPEEEEEYQRLNGLYEKRMAELTTLQGELQKELETEYAKLSKIVSDNITAAIKGVAEGKKLSVVVHKEAVLYGGTDITEEVLARLNAENAG